MDAITKLCMQRFQEFGTAGQANKIKKVMPLSEMAKLYKDGKLKQKIAA